MIRNRRFKKVFVSGTSRLALRLSNLKKSIKSKFNFSNPDLYYHIYETKKKFTRSKQHLPSIMAISTAIIGLIIINSQFAPIQTPAEILGKLANLINMCALLFLVNIWIIHIKLNKIAIFR